MGEGEGEEGRAVTTSPFHPLLSPSDSAVWCFCLCCCTCGWAPTTAYAAVVTKDRPPAACRGGWGRTEGNAKNANHPPPSNKKSKNASQWSRPRAEVVHGPMTATAAAVPRQWQAPVLSTPRVGQTAKRGAAAGLAAGELPPIGWRRAPLLGTRGEEREAPAEAMRPPAPLLTAAVRPLDYPSRPSPTMEWARSTEWRRSWVDAGIPCGTGGTRSGTLCCTAGTRTRVTD